jgi:hypothetical protein
MAYQIYQQHIDTDSGFHVIELRDERGHKHMVQIAIGADACPACGAVHPKDNLGEIDPKAMIASVQKALDISRDGMQAYAKKHGVKLR